MLVLAVRRKQRLCARHHFFEHEHEHRFAEHEHEYENGAAPAGPCLIPLKPARALETLLRRDKGRRDQRVPTWPAVFRRIHGPRDQFSLTADMIGLLIGGVVTIANRVGGFSVGVSFPVKQGASVSVVRAGLFCGTMLCLASTPTVASNSSSVADNATEAPPIMQNVSVHHWKTVPVPKAFLSTRGLQDEAVPPYGGDIRIGDLRNQQTMDFVVYRSAPGGHRHGGVKPVFIGAFDQDGNELWSVGSGGVQPARPGPVAIHDIDGDGRTEVIHLWQDPDSSAPDGSLGDVALQIRDGATGELKLQALPADLPAALTGLRGAGATWAHQRLLICNLRGEPTPRDFILSVAGHLFAFDQNLNLLWHYEIPFGNRPDHASYIPAVGDIDGDGRDEVTGGRYLLDHDGTVLFEDHDGAFTPHMDSALIVEWDNGQMRVIASGGGHVLDAAGTPIVSLGREVVPHGQEVRAARFDDDVDQPQMVIRYRGHSPRAMTVDNAGTIIQRFVLNGSPNNTGMEIVYWHGRDQAALLCNAGVLWNPVTAQSWPLPGLPPLQGDKRMGWYHTIPADLNGDGREEVVTYNPWDDSVHIYGAQPAPAVPVTGFIAGPGQYNPRLMD